MSIKVMAFVWEYSTHSGSDLLMLLAIADHANDHGVCWPSLDRLASRCRVTKRQAIKIVKKLESAGDIAIQHGGGRGHASTYTVKGVAEFTFCRKGEPQDTVSSIKGEPQDTVSSIKGEPQDTVSQETVNPRTPFVEAEKVNSRVEKVNSSSPQPSLEPSKEQNKEKPPISPVPGEMSPQRASKRCPADFQPSDKTRVWAATKYPAVDFGEALEAMRDYEFTKLHTDWDATLRTWIRTEAKQQRPQGRSRASPQSNRISDKGAQSVAAAKRIIEEMTHGRPRHPALP